MVSEGLTIRIITIILSYKIISVILFAEFTQSKIKENYMGKLDGKIALVTGGNSGIGLAAAGLFVAEGARVAITGRNQKTLRAAAAELGDGVLTIQADVTDVEATERAVAAAVEEFGKLDIVFANAGIGGATPVGQTSQAAFDEIIRTNLTAVFFTVQAAAPHLNVGASIILNGSVHAVMGVPGWSAYAATKAGVRAMTAKRLGPPLVQFIRCSKDLFRPVAHGRQNFLPQDTGRYRIDQGCRIRSSQDNPMLAPREIPDQAFIWPRLRRS
jgi:short chain dehydrogenase